MNNLVWTKTPPTVEGYYWHRWFNSIMKAWSRGTVIECAGDGQIRDSDGGKWNAQQTDDEEWAGPIPEPQEPQGERK